jgi:hypothetical protein
MAVADEADVAPLLSPWTVRFRIRWVTSIMFRSVESVWSIQLRASVMLSACWVTAACRERVCIAVLVSVGESDGRVSTLPDVSCCCSRFTAARFPFRPARLLVIIDRWVTRIGISAPRGRCG